MARRRVNAFLVAAATVVAFAAPPAAHAATALYPDLRTLPPRDLELARVDVGGGDTSASGTHNVLRFSNTVWNAGEGDLEVRGVPGPQSSQTPGPAYQRIFDDTGAFTERDAGTVAWHEAHRHYHYDGWGLFQLWTAADYDAWVAQGKPPSTIATTGSKTTSCILDEEFIGTPPATRWPQQYRFSGCLANAQGQLLEGLAVGWGDTYDSWRYDQWIDLGPTRTLTPGEYVLRSVVDPGNKIWESANGADSGREATTANDAIQRFTIGADGALVDEDTPTGTVSLDDVAKATSDTTVNLKVLGRDDVSGVKEFRVSNDGQTWTQPIAYTGVDSTPDAMSWNVADPQFGGDAGAGQKTVRVQFRDSVHSAWGATETDSIELVGPGPGTPYSQSVRADGPLSYWRLDEANATFGALDEVGGNHGQYVGSPGVGAPGLLGAERDHKAVAFDGNDAIRFADNSALDLTTSMTLEAWIKPAAFPTSTNWASVLSKAESYSLQFLGNQLEFTLVRDASRGRERLRLPAGAVPLNQVSHIVATYDGATQRLYRNGEQIASRATTASSAYATGNALYAGSWDGGSEFFNGTIDEPAVYGTVLNQARIRAHYDNGKPPAGPPPAPASLAAVDVSSSRIDLTWLHPSGDESSFVLQRSTDAGFTNPVAINIAENREAYSDTGLEPNRQYWYRILARGPAGGSDWSNVATATTRAAPPVVATSAATGIGESGATLNGSVNPQGATTSYRFEYGKTDFGSSTTPTSTGAGRSPAAVNASLTGLEPSTTYQYRIVATNAGGTTTSTPAATFTTAALAAPTGVGATAASSSAIEVTWVDASNNETGYEVQRSTSASDFSGAATIVRPASATTASDPGLDPNREYHYRVRAVRSDAPASAWSPTASTTTAHALPGAATDGATHTHDTATLGGSIDPKGSPTTYWFEYWPTASSGALASTAPIDAGSGRSAVAASAEVTGLQPATEYTYRVVAQSPGGTARGSNATLTTDAQPPTDAQPEDAPPGGTEPRSDIPQTSPGPGTQPSPGPLPPRPVPPRDELAPLVSFTIRQQRLDSVLRRGLSVRLKSSEPGIVSTRLLVAPSALGKHAKQVQLVVGRATKRLTRAGTTTVVARLGSTARRGLARRRSVKLWVEVTVTDAAGNRSPTIRRPVVVPAKRAARRR